MSNPNEAPKVIDVVDNIRRLRQLYVLFKNEVEVDMGDITEAEQLISELGELEQGADYASELVIYKEFFENLRNALNAEDAEEA